MLENFAGLKKLRRDVESSVRQALMEVADVRAEGYSGGLGPAVLDIGLLKIQANVLVEQEQAFCLLAQE